MAFAQDEAIPVGPIGARRIDVQDAQVKRREDVGRREIAARVAQSGAVEHLQISPPQRVRALGEDVGVVNHADSFAHG